MYYSRKQKKNPMWALLFLFVDKFLDDPSYDEYTYYYITEYYDEHRTSNTNQKYGKCHQYNQYEQ